MADKKGKMPPQLLEYFKNKNKKKEDGKDMSDKEKRKDLVNLLGSSAPLTCAIGSSPALISNRSINLSPAILVLLSLAKTFGSGRLSLYASFLFNPN